MKKYSTLPLNMHFADVENRAIDTVQPLCLRFTTLMTNCHCASAQIFQNKLVALALNSWNL